MENKKLVNILTKDMAELEELIAEVKSKKQFDVLEMEFIHTRAKGVLQLLQMLNTSEQAVVKNSVEEKIILDRLKEKVEKVSQLTSEIKPGNEEKEEQEKGQEEEHEHEHLEQPLPGVVPEPHHSPDKTLNSAENEPEPQNDRLFVAEADHDNETLQYEEDKPEVASRLGDSFLKGKSVNDLINDQVKLEFKLSNRPVSSIQSSIGINDRFQYIRELFGGDNKKFLEAVKTLDSMDNIRDAIDYLRVNYKWKKNETSLKFVNLVKRRFQDTATG